MTTKRFAPVADAFVFSSSDISGLLSDSDEDTIQKQEQNVAGPPRLVRGDKTVGHLGSSTPPHDANNSFTSVTSLRSAAVSKLSEQQDKQQKPKDMRKGSRRNTRNNKKSHGRPKELKINLKNMNMTATFASNEEGLVVSQRMRSSTSPKNGHAGPAKNVLSSSEDSIHIVTDSEEEVIETQPNNNARTQRTETKRGVLPAKNSQQSAVNSNDPQINTVTSVHHRVVTSTPLRETVSPASVTSFVPSPITPAMPPSTVKTRRGRGSPVAESEKMIVSSQKDLDQAAVVPCSYEEMEERDDDSKKCRTSSRKVHTPKDYEGRDDQERIIIFSSEKHRELKSGVPANVLGKSSNRVLSSSEDSIHIVTDSEEEVIETQPNNNAGTQRTETKRGLLPAKNSQQSEVNSNDPQINTVTSVHHRVVTSTPLRETVSPASVTSSVPSPITPAMPPSTVKTRRGRGSPVAESEKMIVSSQKDLDQAAVVPCSCEEMEERDDDSKKCRTSSRKVHTPKDYEGRDDQERITIFSSEKHRELKPGVPANVLGKSSNRILSAQKDLDQAAVVPGSYEEIEERVDDDSKKCRRSSRRLYTAKDYEASFDQEDSLIFSAEKHSEIESGLSANLRGRSSNRFKITTMSRSTRYSRKSSGLRSRKTFGKNQIKFHAEVHAEESAYDGRHLPPNCRVEENAQDIADDKNNVGSSNNDEIKHQNKRAKRIHQEKNTSKMEPNELPDLRRSTRQRVKPLEYWRGERIKYKIGANRCREVAGIDPGFPSRQWVRPPERPDCYEKKSVQFPQEGTKETYSRKLVLVPYGNGNCELECFSTVRIDSDVAECLEGNFTVYTGLQVPGMSAGYVEIGPFCESCSVIDSNLVFHILIGKLTVTIHETIRNVRKGEFFFVPKGVSHTLRNDGEVKALLVFTKYDD